VEVCAAEEVDAGVVDGAGGVVDAGVVDGAGGVVDAGGVGTGFTDPPHAVSASRIRLPPTTRGHKLLIFNMCVVSIFGDTSSRFDFRVSTIRDHVA
jgi:hypothetical protein